jgi:hypothetical protein
MELSVEVADSLAAKVAEIAKEGTYTLPPNEQQRLEKLYSYDVLDSQPEKEFDRITSMAARVFDVPVCIVSLVDAGRNWMKSYHGLAASDASDIPRCVSLCAHLLLPECGNDVYVVQVSDPAPLLHAQ